MCYRLTAHVAAEKCSTAFWDICKEYQLLTERCDGFPRGLAEELKRQGIDSFLFNEGCCDCGTGIGADNNAQQSPEDIIVQIYEAMKSLPPSPERNAELENYSNQAMRDERLRELRQQQLQRRQEQEEELTRYLAFLQALGSCGRSRILLLKHWDEGQPLHDIPVEVVPADIVDMAFLFSMKENVLYSF